MYSPQIVQEGYDILVTADPLIKKWYDSIGFFAIHGSSEVKIDGKWEDIFYKVNPNHKPFSWSHVDSGENIVVRSETTGRIDIAKIIPNGFSLIIGDVKMEAPYSKFSGFLEYYFEIVVMGMINSSPIKSIMFSGFIQYFNQVRKIGEMPNAKYRALIISSERFGSPPNPSCK